MNTCDNCSFLMDDHVINSPKEYLDILNDMQQYIDHGNFILVEQTCSIHDVLKDTWYSDCIKHVMQCKECNSQFVCYADTYHGTGRFYKKDNNHY
ncbi:hypothetical protein SDC9_67393 [bioreactor metagenome]|uniref:Uncharacterized protein n=1 Tax=bioreactor metagenome TaxID=1076179 RepID=A0A644Y491_9ZZZZ